MNKTIKKWLGIKDKYAGASEVSTRPKSAGYTSFNHIYWNQPRTLPPFNMWTIEQMLMEPEVRIALNIRAAPIFGVEWAYKVPDDSPRGFSYKPGIQSDHPEVGEFVQRQLEKIWHNHIHELMESQKYGWAGGEVLLRLSKSKQVEFNRLETRRAEDMRLMVRDGERVGLQISQVNPGGKVNLEFPEALIVRHDPQPGEHYGRSVLLGAYSPWADKWMEGGALDVRRLYMHKDAYGGSDLGYPDGESYIDGLDNPVPNRDIARQIVEQMRAGSVTTRPSTRDANGNELWPLTTATTASNPSHILQYPKDLDSEIRTGIGVIDGIADNEGSTGLGDTKNVAMAAFCASLDCLVISLVSDIDQQVIRHLVELNFGPGQEYQIMHKPLADQAMEQQQNGSGQQGGDTMGVEGDTYGGGPGLPPEQTTEPPEPPKGPPVIPRLPSRMSLDATRAVGEGVLSAAELVKAAKEAMRLSAQEQTAEDPNKQAAAIAEILVGLYGDDAEQYFDQVFGPQRMAWSSIDHPRGPDGRFIEKNSPEAIAAAHKQINVALSGKRDAESLKHVTENLSILTVKQLHDIKRKYGLKASGVKATLVEKIAKRLQETELGNSFDEDQDSLDQRADDMAAAQSSPDPRGGPQGYNTENNPEVLFGLSEDQLKKLNRDGFVDHADGSVVSDITGRALDELSRRMDGGTKKEALERWAKETQRYAEAEADYKEFQGNRTQPQNPKQRDQKPVTENDAPGVSRSVPRIMAYQAEQWGMDVDDYSDIARDVWGLEAERYQERENAKIYARKILNKTKGDIDRIENSGGDSASVKGLDAAGRMVAEMFPDLGWGYGYDDDYRDDIDYGAELFELLREGKGERLSKTSPFFHEMVDDRIRDMMPVYGDPSEWGSRASRTAGAVAMSLMVRMNLRPGVTKSRDGKTFVLNDNHRWELKHQQGDLFDRGKGDSLGQKGLFDAIEQAATPPPEKKKDPSGEVNYFKSSKAKLDELAGSGDRKAQAELERRDTNRGNLIDGKRKTRVKTIRGLMDAAESGDHDALKKLQTVDNPNLSDSDRERLKSILGGEETPKAGDNDNSQKGMFGEDFEPGKDEPEPEQPAKPEGKTPTFPGMDMKEGDLPGQTSIFDEDEAKGDEPEAKADGDDANGADGGPKEGDRDADGLIFRDGRWHREGNESEGSSKIGEVPKETAKQIEWMNQNFIKKPDVKKFVPKGATNRTLAIKVRDEITKILPAEARVALPVRRGLMTLVVTDVKYDEATDAKIKAIFEKHGVTDAGDGNVNLKYHGPTKGVGYATGNLAKGSIEKGAVNFLNAPKESVESVAKGLKHALENHPDVKLDYVGWHNKPMKALGVYRQTLDGYGTNAGIKASSIRFQKTLMKGNKAASFAKDQQAIFERKKARQISEYKSYIENPRMAALKERNERSLARVEATSRWTFAALQPDRAIELVAIHEANHAIYYQGKTADGTVGDTFTKELSRLYDDDDGDGLDGYRIGEYAGSSGKEEYFTEIAAGLAVNADLPPKMVEAYKNSIKATIDYNSKG